MTKDVTLVGDSLLARTAQDGTRALLPRLPSVTNLAVSGASSRTTLEAIKSHHFEPDSLVIISLGMNDAAPWKQVPLPEFIDNYKAIITQIGHKNIVIIVPNPVDVKKQIPPGRDNAVIRHYGEAVVALAKTHQLPYIDLFAAVQETDGDVDLYAPDGVHLSTAGYDLLFEQLRPYLVNDRI